MIGWEFRPHPFVISSFDFRPCQIHCKEIFYKISKLLELQFLSILNRIHQNNCHSIGSKTNRKCRIHMHLDQIKLNLSQNSTYHSNLSIVYYDNVHSSSGSSFIITIMIFIVTIGRFNRLLSEVFAHFLFD